LWPCSVSYECRYWVRNTKTISHCCHWRVNYLYHTYLADFTGDLCGKSTQIDPLSPNDVTVTFEGGRLFMQGSGLPKFELLAETPLSFFGRAFDAQVEFVKDDQTGTITQLNFFQGKQKYPGKKIK